MQVIPIDARGTSPRFRLGVSLDFGVPYLLDFAWNTRDSSWYLDVFERDETAIVSGIRVVLGVFLGRRSPHPLFTSGVIVAVDTSGARVDATLSDFGSRVQLVRYLAQEVVYSTDRLI